MGQDLYGLLRERARITVMRWPLGLVLSVGVHALAVGAALVMPKASEKPRELKVTWVTLPASASTGASSGGAGAMEEGKTGERVRRVEEVAPKLDQKGYSPTPNAFGTKGVKGVSGTNPDVTSTGKAPEAAKGKNPVANPTPGASGNGGGGGLGAGTGIPGLKASSGVQGGSGLIGDLDGNFPFLWYLQQVQGKVTGNWNRFSSAQGRVQVYFRITREGRIEGARVDIPSGNAALDQSALLAVKRSDPLPRLPDGFEGPSLGVRFWFSFLGN